MRVITSCPSRFAIFDQARELHRRGALHRLIHGYPKSYSRRWGIPDPKVDSLVTERAFGHLLWLSRRLLKPSPAERRVASFHRLWAHAVATRLRGDADVFIGLSAFSLEALRRSRQLGSVTVLEHGSLHQRFESCLIAEEHLRWGGERAPSRPPDWLIAQEDSEFAEADYVAVPSRASALSLMSQGVPADKIVVNTLGVDIAQFYPKPTEQSAFRVIQCGSVCLRKGVPYLLQAFSELNLPNSELWLVGAVPDEARLLVERYSGGSIHLKGTYRQSQLADVYGRCSVAVLASVADGFGMVVPQAMACGLPVIVTENVGAADLVRDGQNGFVVPIRSVEALKQRLLILYENPDLRAAMGRAALATVSSGHTWTDYGDRLMVFLNSALDRRHGTMQGESLA